MKTRELARLIPSVPASDGAGVRLRRSLGSAQAHRHDPFLMLDEFFSDDPGDYIKGFPAHPHRGFETVTYLLDGHMRHEDSAGHRGDLGPGGVQWMTAGRGIIHSEMPEQTEGRLRGFQLWINLPAREKMKPASYRDIGREEIPTVALPDGGEVRVIAGSLVQESAAVPEGSVQTSRAVTGPIAGSSTEPLYLDVRLPAQGRFGMPVTPGHNAFLYVYEGELAVGEAGRVVPSRAAALLTDGDKLQVEAGNAGARLLVLAGKPIGEPVVQYGPFVMNTREEIEQALADYRDGVLAAPA